MLQAQIAFSNGQNVDFVGVIRAIAVTDVTSSQTSVQQNNQTSTGSTSGTNINVQVLEVNPPETVTVTIDSDNTTTTSGTTSSSTSAGRIYNVTEANTIYVLEGNWMRHRFDDVILVEAQAPAMRGSFTP